MTTASWPLIALCLVVTCAALYRGLWSDRARGRRRCRRCWHPVHDGMGATATCAECGFTARRERDWTRPRRRWRWVVLAFVALAAAVASGLGPRVRAHGIESLLPTPTLGWMVQRTGSTRALALYLERRTGDPVIISRGATLGTFLGDGEVPAHWAFAWRAKVRPDFAVDADARDDVRDVLLAAYDTTDKSGLNALLLVALARTALVDESARDVLLDALQAQDPWLRCVAAACCCYDGAESFRQDDEFIGALAAHADTSKLNLAFPAIRALSLSGLDHPVVAHAIDQRIERGDRDVRIATYGVLDRFASPSNAAVDRLLIGCAAPEPGVRIRCIRKLAEHAMDARSLPAIRRALDDADSGVRLVALDALVDVMPRGAAFEHILERCASDEDRWVRERAAEQSRLLREETSSDR